MITREAIALAALRQKLLIEEVFEEYTAPDMPKLRDLMSRPSPFWEDE